MPVVGRLYTWKMPISDVEHSFTPVEVITGRTILGDSRWGIALNGEVARSLSNRAYVNCTFLGGRYAAFLEGQENMVFLNCVFDNSGAAPSGTNEEAIIRIQNCKNIYLRGCTFRDATGPKHGYRIHKSGENIALHDAKIDTAGNGCFVGKYQGQSDESPLLNIEMCNVTIEVDGPDPFNIGTTPQNTQNLRIKGYVQTGSAPFRAPAAVSGPGWSVEGFVRG